MWKARIWQPAVLDRFEKYALILVFSILAYRMILSYASTGNLSALIYLFDQSLVLLFIIIRREKSIMWSPVPRSGGGRSAIGRRNRRALRSIMRRM